MPLTPELIVSDLERSLAFWCGLLKFEVAYDRPEERFAFLKFNDSTLMLEQQIDGSRYWITGDLTLPLGRGVNFQIDSHILEVQLETLRSSNWPLFMEPESKTYRTGNSEVEQRQFLVQDPDGYLIRLCETVGTP